MSENDATAAQPSDLPTGIVDAKPWDGVGNEFTGVQFRKVFTRNGERLELYAPKREKGILLDAMALEVLVDQTPEFFTQLIAKQLGSADD